MPMWHCSQSLRFICQSKASLSLFSCILYTTSDVFVSKSGNLFLPTATLVTLLECQMSCTSVRAVKFCSQIKARMTQEMVAVHGRNLGCEEFLAYTAEMMNF